MKTVRNSDLLEEPDQEVFLGDIKIKVKLRVMEIQKDHTVILESFVYRNKKREWFEVNRIVGIPTYYKYTKEAK